MYLFYKKDPIVTFEWLDGDSSAVDQLGEVYGLRRIHAAKVYQILQPPQSEWWVLLTTTEDKNT